MQESAPKLAREPAADRPHTAMTTGMLFLPPAFYGEMMSEAWTAVLGSSQAVKRAAEKLLALKVRVPVTQRNLKKGPPEAVLAIMLGVHAAMRPNKRKPGGIAFSELQAASLCSGLIESLASDELKHQMRAASGWAPGEMEAVISLTFPDAIPLIRGGLHPDRYRYLLALPALIDQLRTAERAHRYRVLMALHIILVDIDVPALTRIALLTWQDELHEFFYAGIHREMLSTHLGAEGFPSDMALQLRDNLSFLLDDRLTPTPQSSPMDCLNGLAMLEMIGGNAGQYLCDIVRDYVYVRIARPLNILLVSYKGISPEGFAKVAGTPQGNCIEMVVNSDVSTVKVPTLPTPARVTQRLLSITREFIARCEQVDWSDASVKLIERMTEASSAIEPLRQKLHELSSGDVKGRTEELSKTALELSVNLEALSDFTQEVITFRDGILLDYELLREEWTEACAQPAQDGQERSFTDQDMHQLIEANEAITAERDRIRQENHRLRHKADALAEAASQAGSQTACLDVDLLRKITLTPDKCTPREVLEYLQLLAGDRLSVLPSAWESADDAERFEYSRRLLSLLDTLVFSYAPSLIAGTPDSQARATLGDAYSACESDATMADQTCRAKREFTYKGEKRVFVRHLKVGNCPGANRGMRIYFDIIDGVVVLAYCGQHLDTSTTS